MMMMMMMMMMTTMTTVLMMKITPANRRKKGRHENVIGNSRTLVSGNYPGYEHFLLFVLSRSEVLFSFYNWLCDRLCCCLVPFSMELVKEQRICVKFCFKVGKTAAETHNMLREAYCDDAACQTTTYEWSKHLKN
jgi:hypothetical protein